MQLPSTARALAWHPVGGLVAGRGDGSVQRLTVGSDGIHAGAGVKTALETVKAVAWHHDGRQVIAAGAGHEIVVVDLQDSVVVATSDDIASRVNDISWDGDRRLAAGTDDGTVEIWGDPDDGAVSLVADTPEADAWVRRFGRPSAVDCRGVQTRAVAWSPGHDNLAIGTHLPVVRLWHRLGEPRAAEPTGRINAVAWRPVGDAIAGGTTDGALRLNAPAGSDTFWTQYGHPGELRSLAWAPDGETLVTIGEEGTILLWEVTPDGPLVVAERVAWAGAVAWAPDGATLAVGGHNRVAILDPDADRTTASYDVDGVVNGLAYAPGGARLAVGTASQDLTVVDLERRTLRLAEGHTSTVNAVRWTTGQQIVTAGFDGRVIVWDPQVPEVRRSYDCGGDPVWAVDTSPTVATSSPSHRRAWW